MSEIGKSKTGNDALKLTSAKLLTMLISLVSSMLLSRFRTLTEYGTYSQIMMTITLVSSLLMLGLPNSINYFLSKSDSEAEREKFLSVYYTINTFLSFIVGLSLVISTPLLELLFKNNTIKGFWYFLAVYPWTKIVMSSVENLLIVYQKTAKLLLFKVTNSIALLLAILIIQVVGGTFYHYMMLFLAVEIIFTIWTYIIVKQNAPNFKFGIDKKLIQSILTFSVPIGLASMIGTIKIELDKIVITSFMTVEDLAVYTNASKELPVTIIATSLSAVLLPKVVKLLKNKQNEQAVTLWKNATTISLALLSIISIGCFTFAEEVITLLYSEKYLAGVTVFRIYCLVLLLRCTYFGLILNATGHTKQILYSSIGCLVVSVGLNYACFFTFGFYGPAIATFLATVAMSMYQLIYTVKIIKVKFTSIFPWKYAAFFIVENAILGFIFKYISHIIFNFYDNKIIIAIVLGIVWALTFCALNFKLLIKQWNMLNKEI